MIGIERSPVWRAFFDSIGRYFQEATAAFLRGDRRAAKELSRTGRHHDNEMKAQHKQVNTVATS
jgi:hypothetical protein